MLWHTIYCTENIGIAMWEESGDSVYFSIVSGRPGAFRKGDFLRRPKRVSKQKHVSSRRSRTVAENGGYIRGRNSDCSMKSFKAEALRVSTCNQEKT